jgi:uncharacterized integral membrane protein (TIGR00697 family)
MNKNFSIILSSFVIILTLAFLYWLGLSFPNWSGLSTFVLIWVIGLGIIALGIFSAEKFGKKYAPVLVIGMLAGFTILADLGSIKLVAIKLGGFDLIAPAGSLLFAVLYFGEDYLNELYGRKIARTAVYAGWFGKLAVALGTLFVIYLFKDPAIEVIASKNQQFNSLLAMGPRLNIVSIIAYLLAGLINVEIFHLIRKFTKEKGLWARSFFSSALGIILDNSFFTFGAFLFTLPVATIWNMTWTTIVVHWTIALWALPFLYLLRHLKRRNVIGSHEQLVILPATTE